MPITDSRESIIQKRGYLSTIAGDQYSLYLSNYPVAAKYLVQKIKNKGTSVAELCCGIGITLTFLSQTFEKVTGVELDSQVPADCKHNLAGTDNVTLIQGDVTNETILKGIHADIVIYDVPYWVSKNLPDGSNVLDHNPDLAILTRKIRESITKNIIIFAPPFITYEEASKLLGLCELQKVFINDRYDRNYIYLGNLIETEGVTEIRLTY